MIRLTTVSNSIEASLIQHHLQLADIKSFTTNDNTSTLLPHFNGMLGHGIQIMVFEEDYGKAQELLTPDKTEPRCPICGSSNIGFGIRGKNRSGDRVMIFLSALVGLPMGNIRNKLYCKDCRKDFT